MQSTNFLVAIIDQNFNMFKTVEGQPKFIEKIAEHTKRLEEISDGHHFYIDETAFKALGETQFPLRFTRVFSENPNALKQSTEYRIHHISELEDTVASKDRFSKNVQIFFIGSSEFLLRSAKFSKKMLITSVKRDNTETANVTDKFPLEEMKLIFKRRRAIVPELLDQIKQYKEIKAKRAQSKIQTSIAPNGMKITQEIVVPVYDASDEILNTPDYHFYEYRR